MTHTLKIKKITQITHDVKSYQLEKPADYSFVPGQATEVSIQKEGWTEEKRPFTFTSLPEDDFLEFIIKSYPDHNGVTEQMDQLEEGDQLIIDDPWGAIQYKGPGVFIAGGAGVTPFIAIFRDLHQKRSPLRKFADFF
jgi:ferredoxin-NADP reductase